MTETTSKYYAVLNESNVVENTIVADSLEVAVMVAETDKCIQIEPEWLVSPGHTYDELHTVFIGPDQRYDEESGTVVFI